MIQLVLNGTAVTDLILAYLGQMLEKGGIGIFPKRLVLNRDSPNPLKLHIYIYIFSFIVLSVFGKFFVNSTDIYVSLSHTVHNREI